MWTQKVTPVVCVNDTKYSNSQGKHLCFQWILARVRQKQYSKLPSPQLLVCGEERTKQRGFGKWKSFCTSRCLYVCPHSCTRASALTCLSPHPGWTDVTQHFLGTLSSRKKLNLNRTPAQYKLPAGAARMQVRPRQRCSGLRGMPPVQPAAANTPPLFNPPYTADGAGPKFQGEVSARASWSRASGHNRQTPVCITDVTAAPRFSGETLHFPWKQRSSIEGKI